jgi:hypothetical protein
MPRKTRKALAAANASMLIDHVWYEPVVGLIFFRRRNIPNTAKKNSRYSLTSISLESALYLLISTTKYIPTKVIRESKVPAMIYSIVKKAIKREPNLDGQFGVFDRGLEHTLAIVFHIFWRQLI